MENKYKKRCLTQYINKDLQVKNNEIPLLICYMAKFLKDDNKKDTEQQKL